MTYQPDLSIEKSFARRIVAGIDEVGRGPWAGPLVAACVILSGARIPDGINDSKKLAVDKREILFKKITEKFPYGIGIVSVAELDELGLTKATELAMLRSLSEINPYPEITIIDGNITYNFPKIEAYAVIKGDNKSLSIAAASIVAKVTRDRIMKTLAIEYPMYGWDKNVGYGTKTHYDAITIYGVNEHHRKSFAPVKAFISL